MGSVIDFACSSITWVVVLDGVPSESKASVVNLKARIEGVLQGLVSGSS